MKPFIALTVAQWKGFFREKQNLFWIILFPLLFLFLFGSIFRDTGQSKSDLVLIGQVQLIDQMPQQGKDAFGEIFTMTKENDRDKAIQQVRDGDADAALEMQGNKLVLHYSKADAVKAATVQGTMESFVQNANNAVAKTRPVFTLDSAQVEDKSLRQIQYLTPGLLGWAIAMGATFGAAMTLVLWRQNMLLRRLRLSPVSTLNLVLSRTVISLAVALLQFVIFVGAAMLFFNLKLTGSWWMALPLAMCGTFAFMSIGLLAGAVSKTAEAASGLANLIILPMAFLSGSFISMDIAPDWMTTVSKLLPMGHLNQGLMDVMVRGKGPSSAILPMAILLGFAVVIALIASKIFRWEK